MKEKTIKALLRLICKDYLEAKKSSFANLNTYRFDAFIFTKSKIAEFVTKKKLENDIDLLLTLLEDNGYVKSHFDQFELTELGYKLGTQSIFAKCLDWLNKNQGLILVLTLVVTICGLFSEKR